MSLLLDALKEAEARKRDASPPPAIASTTSPEPAPFETLGTLALAEDAHPAPDGSTAATATPLRAAPTPAETLLAARAARAPSSATRGPAGGAPTPAVPGAAVPTPAPAHSPDSRKVDPSASPSAASPPARPKGLLPWLVGAAGVLALLVGGAFLYDTVVNRAPPAYPVPRGDALEAAALPVPAASGASAPLPAAPTASPASAPALASAPAPAPAPARSRSDEPRETARRDATPDAPAPRSGRTGAGRAPSDAPGIGTASGESRLSISREPAPLDAAWAAQQAGDLDRAESLYRRVLESEQGQVDAQLGLAVIAHARGNDAAARRGYRQVLESAPEHPRAWAGLAELAGEDDAGGIESRLRQLLANRPSGPLHFALGNVLARQERWPDAQQEYFAAATLAPDAPDYAYNVAVALERLGKPAAAVPWYSRALRQAASGRAVRFDALAARARLDQLQAAPP
jgi:Flp pilus assembly protein TadD